MNVHDTPPPERTNMQNYVDAMWRLAYAVVLLLATLVGVGAVNELLNGQGYSSFIGLLYVATYVLLAPALVLQIVGRDVPRAMRLVSRGLVGLLGLLLVLMAIGNLRSALGAVCRDFSGVDMSCADSHLSIALILLVSPYVFTVLIAVCLLGLAKGWRDYLKHRSAK